MESLSEGIKTDAKDAQIVHTLSAQKVQSWAFGDELVRTIQIENAPFFVAKDVSMHGVQVTVFQEILLSAVFKK